MALQAAADELYALPPEQFTAARDDFAARLRQAGERALATAVRDLRRPSVSAWLVNLLVRHRSEELDQLLEIGDRLRSAMANGAGSDVRGFTEDRRTAIATLTADLAALAGRPVARGAVDEVRLTLEAATADPTAATAVRSGRLVRALRYAGFGELPDLAGAVGLASSAQPVRRGTLKTTDAAGPPSPAAAAAVREAERTALEAAGRADDAQRVYEQRVVEQAAAAEAVTRAEDAVASLRHQLAEAQSQLAAVRGTEGKARADADVARRTARAAHRAADTARQQLAKARPSTG